MPLHDLTAQEYLLAARCPECHHQPTARYSRETVEYAQGFPLDRKYRDEKCVRCGTVYLLAWVAVAHAFPAEQRATPQPKPWAA